jgi:hypothetical protein
MSSSTLTRALPSNPVNASVTTAQLFANKQVPAVPTVLGVLGTGRLEQKKFTLRASGRVLTGATATVIPTLYVAAAIPAVPFTAANWTLLCAGGAVSLASLSAAWEIEADVVFESLGGTMEGRFTAMTGGTLTATAALTNVLTGLNGTSETITQEPSGTVVVAAEPVFYVACGLTFSVANAGNIGYLGDFCLDG